jgi:hypothetical protein
MEPMVVITMEGVVRQVAANQATVFSVVVAAVQMELMLVELVCMVAMVAMVETLVLLDLHLAVAVGLNLLVVAVRFV